MMSLLKKKQRILENSLQIEERERNILNVLCYEYTSVYMVDLQADWAEIIKLREKSNVTELVGREEKKIICYSRLLKDYYDRFVIKEEYPHFLEMLSAENLMEELKRKERDLLSLSYFPECIWKRVL